MSHDMLRVLLVEDNTSDVRLLLEMFSKERQGSFELLHAIRMSDGVKHLDAGGIDIVLLDMGLPDEHGVETVRRAHAAAPDVPIIVLTGLDDEVLAAAAMNAGAQDYLIKGQIESRALPRALRHAIERHRMQAETERIRADQMRFKEEFLSHVSHELRSPLAAIHQFVTILVDGLAGDLTLEQQQHLDIVLRNATQLRAMIDDLLEVARSQFGQVTVDLQNTSVPDAVGYAVSTLRSAAGAKNITLSTGPGHRVPMIRADPIRMRQIALILIENAIKFTPPDGQVRVRVGLSASDPRLLVLEVSDSGPGIQPHMLEAIFERLVQEDSTSAARKGLGLGLYICRDLVARQDGTITAGNAPGGGATFSVTMPVASVTDAIARAIKDEHWSGDLVAVVRLAIGARGALPEDLRVQVCRDSRAAITRWALRHRALLLPAMVSGGPTEECYVVAFGTSHDVAALATQVAEEVRQLDCVRDGLLTCDVSQVFVGPPATEGSPVEVMAARIGTLINSGMYTLAHAS
jgi:signal transduction histidine kinase